MYSARGMNDMQRERKLAGTGAKKRSSMHEVAWSVDCTFNLGVPLRIRVVRCPGWRGRERRTWWALQGDVVGEIWPRL